MNHDFSIAGHLVDVIKGEIFNGIIHISGGIIVGIEKMNHVPDQFILPGLTDAHIHIESSMLIPSEFARLAVIHGTIATVSDPHEIANVLGIDGIRFMIENGKKVPFKFSFGAPSCVPATPFETTGSNIGVDEIEELLKSDDIYGLSEMMNFPGVLFENPEVVQMLSLASKYGKPVDGHAPGLTGDDVKKYIMSGISTDHECYTIDEALEKIKFGMKILIREGSAAKNFETLACLIEKYPEMVMFCSDDKHPNDLVEGHINTLVKRAIAMGFDPLTVIRCATLNPKMHYHLNTGLLQTGDSADFIVVNNLEDFTVMQTFVNGIQVAENGNSLINSVTEKPLNSFSSRFLSLNDIQIEPEGEMIRVIKVFDGQLITEEIHTHVKVESNNAVSNLTEDILKIVVKNRFSDTPPSVGFIKGFGLKKGAIASSIAHDSHNIIAVGADDSSLVEAINLIIAAKGGISCIHNGEKHMLSLPYAGLMTDEDGFTVAAIYKRFDQLAKEMGSALSAPFMTLSFMALLVIPDLKLSDKGLFDGKNFRFTDLFVNDKEHI